MLSKKDFSRKIDIHAHAILFRILYLGRGSLEAARTEVDNCSLSSSMNDNVDYVMLSLYFNIGQNWFKQAHLFTYVCVRTLLCWLYELVDYCNEFMNHYVSLWHTPCYSFFRSCRSLGGERTVKRLRLTKALTMPENTTVYEICRRMAARRVDAALLTDSNALLCGILTDKVNILKYVHCTLLNINRFLTAHTAF